MKKKLLFLLLPFLALAACSNEGAEGTDDVSSLPDEVESSSQASSEEQASAESEDELPAEPVDFAYEVNQDIFTIQPLEGVDAPAEVALLTFDDAPQEYALSIAETVKEKEADAIFFVMGQFLEDPAAKDIIKSIYDMGFEIGNHSYSHPTMTDLTHEEQMDEIRRTNDLVEEATGVRPRFFRSPYGIFNEDTLAVLEAEAMTNMNWTYGYDWEEQYMNGPALADIMVNTEFLGDGANLLMHDRPWTAEAIADIIDGLRGKGYEIVDPKLIASPSREAQ